MLFGSDRKFERNYEFTLVAAALAPIRFQPRVYIRAPLHLGIETTQCDEAGKSKKICGKRKRDWKVTKKGRKLSVSPRYAL